MTVRVMIGFIERANGLFQAQAELRVLFLPFMSESDYLFC